VRWISWDLPAWLFGFPLCCGAGYRWLAASLLLSLSSDCRVGRWIVRWIAAESMIHATSGHSGTLIRLIAALSSAIRCQMNIFS
jgi:RNA:NAD 2'-phosphotransferase (TPT1/KptA family)